MSDLTDFLLARIAEDEALAQEAERVYVHPGAYDPMFGARKDDEVASRYWDRIADPARVLAECEAKRRIVDWRAETADREAQDVLDDVLQYLALPYADHPDYDEAWRP